MAALNPKVSKKADGTILMNWNPDTSCFGYRFYRDGIAVSKSTKPTQATTTFKAETDGRQHSYGLARATEQTPEEVEFPADPTPPPPPPPPPPPTPSIKGSIAQGSTLTGKVTWTADNGPCVFTIDGGSVWKEGLAPYVYGGDGATLDTATLPNGSHTFKVALQDGTADHIVTATVQNATVPPPPPPSGGGKVGAPGLIRLAGLLPTTSHLDAYALIIGDWELVDLVAKQAAVSYAYRNLGPPGWKPINLSDPDGFVNECLSAKRANPGLDGIFLDNTNSWDKATQMPFLKNVGPRLKAAGLGVMPNAMASSSSMGGLNQDDGSADRAWYAEIAPYIGPYVFMEYYQMDRSAGRSTTIRHRGPDWQQQWDGWQKCAKAIHDLGFKVVGASYNGRANAIYCRASFLLVAGPGDVFCGNYGSAPDGADSYDPAWMKDMGDPIDPPDASKTSRRFTNGTVSVDPVAGTATIT
jgi:hypothetical protein